MALIQVSFTGNPAPACRYWTVCVIEGRSYTLFVFSVVGELLVSIVQSFAPFGLHPWRIGSIVVVIVTVPGLCIITPFSPGWKIVVYPSSVNLLTLTSAVFRPGRMSASRALPLNCSNGSLV